MWDIIQCKVQGRGHQKSHIPCQDQIYTLNKNNVQVIALADGAGSARLSHYGALEATKRICQLFTEEFDQIYENDDGISVKQFIIEKLHYTLSLVSQRLQCNIQDLASTLLFVAVKDHHMISGHIGDGVIGYLKGDHLNVLSTPKNGEYINSTYFITSQSAFKTMKLVKGDVSSINGFVLMSDGTEESLYNKSSRRLAPVFTKIMDLTRYISSSVVESDLQHSFENVISHATLDDCSMIMMIRHNDHFSGYLSLTRYDKAELLHLDPHCSKKVIAKYDAILTYLYKEKTLNQISQQIHLKPKHTKKCLNKLVNLNLIAQDQYQYKTLISL